MSFIDFVGLNNIIPKNIDSDSNTISLADQKAFWHFGQSIADTITIGQSGDWEDVIGAGSSANNDVVFHFWYKKTQASQQRLVEFKNSSGTPVVYIDNEVDGTFALYVERTITDGLWVTTENLDLNKWYLITIRFSPNTVDTKVPLISFRPLGGNKVNASIIASSTPDGDFTGLAGSLYYATIGNFSGEHLIGQISQFAVFRSSDATSNLNHTLYDIGINGNIIKGGLARNLGSVVFLYYISAAQTPYGQFPRELSNFTASLSTDYPPGYSGYTNSYFLYDGARFAGPNAYLNPLLNNTNGPYGHPTFKQIRTSENPLTRYQVANNKYSIVEQPSDQVNIGVSANSNYKVDYVSSRYGNIVQFDEMCLTSKHKPLLYVFGIGIDNPRIENKPVISEPNIERIIVRDSFGNEIDFFGNRDLNNRLKLQSLTDQDYERIKEFYLNGGLDADDSPISTFELLKYGETVWPREIYAFRKYTRQRTTYLNNFWRNARSDRETTGSNGFGNDATSSMWNMDAAPDWTTRSGGQIVGYTNVDKAGILQNNYSLYAPIDISTATAGQINTNLKPAPYYTRLHSLSRNESVVAPSGIKIPETGSGGAPNIGQVFQGTALWEAGSQSGRDPFYASYDNFISDVRPKYKDYSIIPEYTVSKFVEDFYHSGSNIELNNFLQISGGLENNTDSSDSDFYKVYSTSDFLGHFAKIKKDHEGFTNPSMIKLTCKGVKKFIAHDSFYPQQRTVDIAKQFWNSFNQYVSSSVTTAGPKGSDSAVDITKQNLLNPLFAPGVLYNSIKAGVACDYPMITGSLQVGGTGNASSIMNSHFDFRVPFEALLNPQGYLTDVDLISNEPHPSGNLSASCIWNGGGETLYNAMVSNFCAETADFFLANGNFTYLQSLPQSDPNFGQLVAGERYGMRVRMYRSMENFNTSFTSGSNTYMPPQDEDNEETITMYSRPSAFGPACGAGTGIGTPSFSGGSMAGYNFPFTPPYYHGQSWCDIIFEPDQSRKYSLNEIINSASYKYIRVDDYALGEQTSTSHDEGPQAPQYANSNAMQLSASLIVNGVADFKASIDGTGARVTRGSNYSSPSEGTARSAWTIQTRYETPILNFKNVSLTTASVNLHSAQTPRGMWHQYGVLPEGDEGIYMDVVNIPPSWRVAREGDTPQQAKSIKSLAESLGFSQNPVRLGNTRNRKAISEAIVAIPFIDVGGVKKFFEIQRETVDKFVSANLDPRIRAGSPTVFDMLKKMKKYNFPPKFDFLKNREVVPFAMYIFEFYHVLNEADLNNIWQGLPPDIGLQHEEVQASISHPLLAKELLGGGFYNNNVRTGDQTPEKIRWLVFKVKRKAKKNYYRKILSKQGVEGVADIPENLNYNWPYDFFSLVELAKIDAEFTFSDIALKGSSVSNVPRGRELFEKSSRTEALLGSSNNPADAAATIVQSQTGTGQNNFVGQGSRTGTPGDIGTVADDSPDQPQDLGPDFPEKVAEFFDFEKPDNDPTEPDPDKLPNNTVPENELEEPEI